MYRAIKKVGGVCIVTMVLSVLLSAAEEFECLSAEIRATKLYNAVLNNETEQVSELLKKMSVAERNCVDYYGQTLLHIASDNGFVDVVCCLLIAGLEPDAQEYKEGYTPLHRAVFRGHVAVVELLLRYLKAPGINKADVFGNRPFAYAQSDEVRHMLLCAGADLCGWESLESPFNFF